MWSHQTIHYKFSILPIHFGMGNLLHCIEPNLSRLDLIVTTNSNDTYRFGFNGKEKDDEVKGAGGQQDYGMRIYDPRLGRFLSVDPLTKDYPWYTPYQFAGNKPIWAIDLDGAEEYYTSKGELIGKYGTSTEIRVVFDVYVKAAQDMITQQSIAPNPTTDMTNCMLYNKGSSGAYKSTDEAAFEWASKYNQQSIDMNKEMGSDIFVVKINGKSFCAFEQPVIGGKYSVSDPIRDFTVAHIHSHGAYVEGVKSNEFSKDIWSLVNGSVWEWDISGDINNYQDIFINGYVSTPNGSLLKYTYLEDSVSRIGGMYAFDKNDPETPDLGTDTPDIYEEKTEINSTNDE